MKIIAGTSLLRSAAAPSKMAGTRAAKHLIVRYIFAEMRHVSHLIPSEHNLGQFSVGLWDSSIEDVSESDVSEHQKPTAIRSVHSPAIA